LAGETPLAGYYYYNEGLTHLRHTGHFERAIFALSNAEKLESWVSGVVFQGAATYNLGLALQNAGQFDEAAAAFQRVVACDSCINYQKPAAAALTRYR
jgi:tetratricopeptide (TPR) repeat protein